MYRKPKQILVTIDGETTVYNTVKEAADAVGISTGGISYHATHDIPFKGIRIRYKGVLYDVDMTDKELVPLRLDHRTVIYVHKWEQTEEFAEMYKNKIGKTERQMT